MPKTKETSPIKEEEIIKGRSILRKLIPLLNMAMISVLKAIFDVRKMTVDEGE
ncbi:MAG: hypothetical protein U5L09_01590 [Bacteroidales bacterium]|nr:hypothetical protein [Bacteroidales bacterium]